MLLIPSLHFFSQGFDAVLTDPMVPTGSLIARKLGEFPFSWVLCVFEHLHVPSAATGNHFQVSPRLIYWEGLHVQPTWRPRAAPPRPHSYPVSLPDTQTEWTLRRESSTLWWALVLFFLLWPRLACSPYLHLTFWWGLVASAHILKPAEVPQCEQPWCFASDTQVAVLEPLFCRLMFWHFDHIASEFLEEEVGIMEVLSDSDIWLLRYLFTFTTQNERKVAYKSFTVKYINK